jgi:DNA modification methylase
MKYIDFLKSKVVKAESLGIEISKNDIHPILFPHQRDIVHWAASGGRRAIFASFGLGKTLIQLELMRIFTEKCGGRGLIICPLGVKQEFIRDGKLLGMDNIQYVRTSEEVEKASTPYLITNYERVRDGGIDPSLFTFASLDEASVLRGYGTKTYQKFIDIFPAVKYRFVCTATPSPNRHKELIHYAGFLGIMDTGQALTRFFKRDSTKANNLTLYEHKEKEFWLWISTWASFIQKPSDFGYSDEGYSLPELKVIWHRIDVDHSTAGSDKRGQVKMFRDSAVSLQDAAREKRESMEDRINKAVEIVGESPDDHYLIWYHLEKERHALKKAIPASKHVYGSQKLDDREDLIIGFSEGEFPILGTKPEIAGSGCNFQRYCHKNIFLGINYSFNDFIQAVHRTHRFQQKNQVEVHIIYAESEEEIRKTLERKWEEHEKLVRQMTGIIREYGLTNKNIKAMERAIGVARQEVKGQYYTAVNNDCVVETQKMKSNSVDLIHTSIPFSNHYEYTPSYNDFGHNSGDDRFFEQMDFLVPELHRILKPGRVAAIHVKDRILYGNVTGLAMPSVNPFSDKTTQAFVKHGFVFFGRITVVTDVVRENNQTYRLGWSENCKDGTKMGAGMPEYVLLFRKLPSDLSNAYADEPVKKNKEDYTRAQWQIDAHGFWRSRGDRFFTPEELSEMDMERIIKMFKSYSLDVVYDYENHVEMGKKLEELGRLPASFMLFPPQSHNESVWTDVNRMNTLNTKQSQKRLMNHVCPLQFDIVERIINRYSNEGELVLDPFGGLMTVPYCAVKMNRKGYGIELNSDYWFDGIQYLKAAEYKREMPTLFDLVESE